MIHLNRVFSLFCIFLLYSWVTVAGAAPLNDNFNSPISLAGTTGTESGDNTGATAEAGEPNHGSGDSTAFSSIWFSWTATSSEEIFFNTFGSDIDTVIAAYTGTALTNLQQQATNDDFGPDVQSQIHFIPTAGTTYYIAVDGYSDTAQGNIVLQWLPSPINDDFANATQLTQHAGTISGNNVTATIEAGEPIHSEEPEGPFHSVWYSWTATNPGRIMINTFGSNFDTTMAAYEGIELESLTQIAVNDDSGTTSQSKLTFQVATGSTYHIAVDGFDEDVEVGSIVLNYQYTPHFLPAINHLLLRSD